MVLPFFSNDKLHGKKNKCSVILPASLAPYKLSAKFKSGLVFNAAFHAFWKTSQI